MESLASLFSPAGRMASRPFALGVVIVYAVAVLSQLLISPTVALRSGLVLFALSQSIVSWAWFCLHAQRLRDAGHGPGAAMAIAILYVLAMVLLMLTAALIAGSLPNHSGPTDLILFFLLAMQDPHLGLFGYVIVGFFALILVPMLIAIGFSIWAGTRPTAPSQMS